MARKFRAGLLSVWKSALDFISRIPSSEQGVRFGSYADKKCFNKLTQDVRDGIHLRNRPRKRFPGRIVGSFAYKNDKWLSRLKKRNIKQTLLFSGLKGWADEAAALIQNYFFFVILMKWFCWKETFNVLSVDTIHTTFTAKCFTFGMEIVNSGVNDRRFLTGNSCTEERARERERFFLW